MGGGRVRRGPASLESAERQRGSSPSEPGAPEARCAGDGRAERTVPVQKAQAQDIPETDRPDALRRVLAVARRLGGAEDLREILSLIIDAMRDVLDAERATVFEFDEERQELYSTVAHGLAAGAPGSDGIRIPITAGIAGQCARTREVINVPDAYADGRFNQAVDKATGFRTRSILTIPLEDETHSLIGVAQVLNKRSGPFDAGDEEIAAALAAQAAVAIKRAHLLQDRLVREKLERDLELARHVQQESFPRSIPRIVGYDLAGVSEPADETGGDAYDLIGLSQEGGRVAVAEPGDESHASYLMLADATGHGIGPALSVTQALSMLRMGARIGASLADIAQHMNSQLCNDLPSGRFITAWLARLDAATNTLETLSAGQAPLLLLRAGTGEVVEMAADVVPLGITPFFEPERPAPIVLAPGDVFAVLSDGFYEAANPKGELLGVDRVVEALRSAADGSAADMIEAVRAALRRFCQGVPAADDQTAVIVKRLPA